MEQRGLIVNLQPMPASHYRGSIERCFGSHIPSRAFFVPNLAKYPHSIVSESAVARPELWIALADSLINTPTRDLLPPIEAPESAV